VDGSGAQKFDLVVIGGGTAGLVTAAAAASLGARTALVERERLGGECLWTGCVPSKALIGSARVAHAMRTAGKFGLESGDPAPRGDRVLRSVRDVREVVQHHDDPERFRKMGVEVIEGAEARFLSDREVEADGRRLAARRFVIATGSRPAIPPIEGLEEAGYVTHETAFDRDSLPRSAVVLGGGAIGVEFAQAYRRLGVEVTLVEMEERILPFAEPELAVALERLLEEEGIRVLTGHRAVSAGREGDDRILELEQGPGQGAGKPPGRDGGSGGAGPEAGSSDGNAGTGDHRVGGRRTLRAEELFVATGRRPNVESLGLERAGVETERSGVRVDGTLRTTRSHIYAAGDVVGGQLFTHVADHEARTVVRNALFPFGSEVDYSVVPWTIYTDPALASVGLTEAEARERHGDAVRAYRYDVSDLDRAIADRAARGTVKLIVGRRGKLLGGHVLAAQAGTMIVEVALAMDADVGVGKLSELIHPYPTMSEGVRRAANEYVRSKLTPTVRTWLDRWFRLSRRLGL